MGSRRTRGDVKRMREQWRKPIFEEEEEEEVQKQLNFKDIFGDEI